MRCVRITASDDRMDCHNTFRNPINPLPLKCPRCGFPNLDHIPQPYFLTKSRTMSPHELALAANGNLLIRERIRRVLDLLTPGECSFFPTCYKGTSEQTPWLLAVPNHQVESAKVNPSIPRCDTCDEPRSAHPGSQWSEFVLRGQLTKDGWTCELERDILKSSTWGSSEQGWDQWILRDVFLSVRLLHLLKKIKARGLYEATCQKPHSPNKEESVWIKQKLQVLEANSISSPVEGTLSADDASWLRHYLKNNARSVLVDWDIQSVERQLQVKLPKSYLDFVSTVGPTSFENVDEQEGFSAFILSPNELDINESQAVGRLTFAKTGHGDYFCFDIQKGKKEFAVSLYKHEYQYFELYAENFAACIRRFEAHTG